MVNKKKILLITASGKIGGGPKHVFLLKEILKDYFEFYLAMPKTKLWEAGDFNNKNYIEISERKISLKDIYNLIYFAKKNSIDIIHSHGKGAGFIGRIIKFFFMKPLIYSFHGIHNKCLGRLKRIIYFYYEIFTGWIDDEKVFVSESEMLSARKSNIYIGNNFTIINNATKKLAKKENILTSNTKLSISKLDNSKKNIISVCRLVEQKNIFEIFKIANHLNEYNFIILGDGDLYLKAKEYLIFNNINNVYLLGNKDNVFEFLYKGDLFLSTSLYEGLPISVLEAMSVGIPIVASNVPGNCDTIEHNESGLLYELGDIRQAIFFIRKIMNNKKLKKKFSDNAYFRHNKLFSIQNMRLSYLNLYKKYLD